MKTTARLIFAAFVLLNFYSKLLSQDKINKDSLLNQLQVTKDDTGKVKILRNLCLAYQRSEPDKAIEYGEQGILLSEKLNFQRGKSECLHETGVVHYYQGQYDKSLERYLSALKILEEKNDTSTADIKKLIADNLHDIGKVYYRQKQFEKALDSYEQALSIYKQLNFKSGIATCYNNMGGVFDARNDPEKTLYYLKESLKITEEIGDKPGIATRVNNIGLQYKSLKKYNEALSYLMRAMKIREEIGDTKGLAYSYNDIGGLYLELKNYEKALGFLNKGLEYAKKANAKERIKASYETLSLTYSQLKQFDKAYQYHLLFSELKDSIFNEDASRQIAEMSAKYESDKKQREIELLQKDKDLQASKLEKSDAERKNQQVQKTAFALGFTLVFILALVIFRSYRNKQKANIIITAQKNKVEVQKKIIEEKNKDITDSIEYAKGIQDSIIPPEENVKELLPESFVLFRPKDIVSGDFYWVAKRNGTILLAVCDCTGHGVPGAFVSMVGANSLTRCLNEYNLIRPAEILDKLSSLVEETFHERRDGMDVSLCSIDITNNRLTWAGANNPLWLVSENGLKEFGADKQPIGKFDVRKPFKNHEIKFQKNDTFYFFSDGYSDQFGGAKGKKFKQSKFKELLLSIRDKKMDEQKNILEHTIDNWRGDIVQIDDICVIGIRM